MANKSEYAKALRAVRDGETVIIGPYRLSLTHDRGTDRCQIEHTEIVNDKYEGFVARNVVGGFSFSAVSERRAIQRLVDGEARSALPGNEIASFGWHPVRVTETSILAHDAMHGGELPPPR